MCCWHALAGTLRCTVGATTRDLTVGNTMHRPAGEVHRFSNPFASEARALIVLSPDIGPQHGVEMAAATNAAGPPDKAALLAIMTKHRRRPAPPNS